MAKGDQAVEAYVKAVKALKATGPSDTYVLKEAQKAARVALGNLNGGALSRARLALAAEGITA